MQDTTSIFTRIDKLEADIARLSRERLRLLRELDLERQWDHGEYRNVYHWVAAHLQISWIDARRRVDAAHAIESLPLLSAALESGELSLDKVVQLTRFATPENERKLITWAEKVSVKTVRESADAAEPRDLEEVTNADRLRNFGWRTIDNGVAMSFFGALPAEQGELVAQALDRVAESLENAAHEEIEGFLPIERAETLPQRRADALVLMASHEIASDFDADRATMIVHAEVSALAGGDGCCELDDGTLLHPETARRLSCDARLQTVLEDGAGGPIGIGRTSAVVPPWLKRLVKHRDRGCVFPGCEDRRYSEAHHVRHWAHGGPTELDNLVLVCGFHHKAVHEYGWSVSRTRGGGVEWFRPSGRLHGVRLPRPRDSLGATAGKHPPAQ